MLMVDIAGLGEKQNKLRHILVDRTIFRKINCFKCGYEGVCVDTAIDNKYYTFRKSISVSNG